jgi:hypothetical protein
LVLAGLLVSAAVLLAHSSLARRPVILQLLAAVAVAFGTLLVIFPYSRAMAYPDTALALSETVLLVVGWKDIKEVSVKAHQSSS